MINKLFFFLILTALLTSASVFAQDFSTGLKLHYTFDNVSGTLVPDASGNSQAAILMGAATLAEGKIGQAVCLTTVDDYVQLPNDITTTLTDYTVACWVNLNTVNFSNGNNYWGRIFDFGNGTANNMFMAPQNGAPYYAIKQSNEVGEQSVKSSTSIFVNTWTHVAVTCSFSETTGLGTLRMYLNGLIVATKSDVTTTPASMGTTLQNYIGKSQYADSTINGKIDDFRIYSRALTSEDIMTMTGIPAALVSAYKALTIAGTLTEVIGNLTLPTTVGNDGVTVAWASTDSATVSPLGVIARHEKYKSAVILTATLSLTVAGVTSTFSKSFEISVLPLNYVGDVVALWNFSDGAITTADDGTISVKEESDNSFVAKCVGGAQMVKIGKDQQFNVLSIGESGQYFDFGIEIGKAVYGLIDYTISMFYRKDTTDGTKDWNAYGQLLYGFSNGLNLKNSAIGAMYFEPRRARHVNTHNNYESESSNFVGGSNLNGLVTPLGTWHNVTYSQTNGVGVLYFDGVQYATGNMAAPAINLKRTGQTGTLYNSIGRPFYTENTWLTNTLVYGFNMFSVGLSVDDLENVLKVQSTITALDAAFEATTYDVLLYVELGTLLTKARTAAESNYTPAMAAINAAIAVGQADFDNKVPSVLGNQALDDAITAYNVAIAPWNELNELIKTAESYKTYNFPGLQALNIAIDAAKAAYAAPLVTQETIVALKIAMVTYLKTQPSQITDIDGNKYNIITIGTQVWMVENLKTTRYRNGEAIGTTTPASKDISSESSPKYQWVCNDNEENVDKYGRLYSWHTLNDSRSIAPTGWHVSTDAEWITLQNYLIANGYNYDGTTTGNKIAKSMASTTDWDTFNAIGYIGNDLSKNNTSGFTALPGAYRSDRGAFAEVGSSSIWWTSTEFSATSAWGRSLTYSSNNLNRINYPKGSGFYVRCVRDLSATIFIPTLSTTAASGITTTSATGGGNITNDGDLAVSARGVCWNTTGTPTLTDNVTNDGTGTGSFESNMTNLTANTLYYVRAYATNSVGTSYGNEVSFTTLQGTEETATDIDGNVYHTIKIGTQTWMLENLKTTKYRNGEAIGTTTPANKDIRSESAPKHQWPYNGDESNTTKYGRLYTWYAVNDSRNIAPAGWHVPTDAEWTILENYLIANGNNYDGTTTGNKIAKSLAATTDWNSYSDAGSIGNDLTKNNSSGFTALPGGCRDGGGTFGDVGNYGGWWSSAEYGTNYAWCRHLNCNSLGLFGGNMPKNRGFSVRCVRDSSATIVIPTLITTAASGITTTSATGGGDITNDGGAAVSARGVCWNTTGTPTLTDNVTNDGTGSGSFVSNITGLTPNTPYYVRTYATNSLGTSYGNEVSFTTRQGTVTDIDGNMYYTVKIGTQEWMVENLKTTKYRNGEVIGTTTPANKYISDEIDPKYQWSYNGDESNASKYGRLYTWYAVNDIRNIAPAGWHVPTDAEWTTLENYLIANGYNYDGTTTGNKIAKSLAATTLWNTYTMVGSIGNDLTKNNTSGFAGLPGGYRANYGPFWNIGDYGCWWSSAEYSSGYALGRGLGIDWGNINGLIYYKQDGFSVRCVRDSIATIVIPTLSTTAASGITTTSATGGGNISNDGGAAISARGVCWNTTGSPTLTDNVTNDGTGSGSFVSNISGLTPNTLYYVRAYATNSLGTSYSNEVSFRTYLTMPIANAGPDQTVNEGATVTLNGSASSDPENDALTYVWTAPEGITLNSTTSANPTFIAPEVFVDTQYNFSLVVNDGNVDSPADKVTITVNNVTPSHFLLSFTGNGQDHMNINIMTAAVDGLALEAGDEIAVFDGTICCGKATLTQPIDLSNNNTFVAIGASKADDGQTNGYTIGHAISYKFWDTSKGKEFSLITADYLDSGTGQPTAAPTYTANGSAFVKLSRIISVYTQEIPLISGWNIISSNVIPSKTNLKEIVQPLIDAGKMKKMMDESGKAIENFGAFGGWKNNIGDISQTEGYKVNMTGADTLVLEGAAIPLPLDIPLISGWNIISYPCADAQNAQTMVQSLIDAGKLKKVMDESGKSIENFGAFGGWKNNIGNLIAGKGFKINMTGVDTLNMTSSELRSAINVNEILPSKYFKKSYEGNGTDHMNINLVDLEGSGLQVGDEIGIFDGKFCVGSAIIGNNQMQEGSISIPTSSNDEMEVTLNGFIPGHAIEIRLYSNGETFNLTTEKLWGSDTFEKNGSLFAKVKSRIPTGLTLTNEPLQFVCYPNPFREEIQIDVNNTKSTALIVEIYNLYGQKVKRLYDGVNTGLLNLKWNGTDDKGNQVEPGIYLCKVGNQTKKIIYIGKK